MLRKSGSCTLRQYPFSAAKAWIFQNKNGKNSWYQHTISEPFGTRSASTQIKLCFPVQYKRLFRPVDTGFTLPSGEVNSKRNALRSFFAVKDCISQNNPV